MQCPVCRVDLKQSDLGQFGFVVLDVCPQCGGAWFDKGDLDRLDESIWVNVEEQAFDAVEGDHKEAVCPKCRVSLRPVSPIDEKTLIVDRCPSCDGFWLDGGELAAVQNVADELRSELTENIEWIHQPLGWSSLRWAAHCFRQCYSKGG